MWVLLVVAAMAQDPDALDHAHWNDVGERRSDVGLVHLRKTTINDVMCIEGTVDVPASASALHAVTTRMVTSPDWSSADLLASEELARDGDSFVLYQHFNSPGWTLSADRYWIVQGVPEVLSPTTSRYRWHRLPASDWPSAALQSEAVSRNAVEMPANYGEWLFTQQTSTTALRYRACADIGGRVPATLVTWLTTQQVPDLIAELATEALRAGNNG
ncbi:MAG: hypothetical protein ACJAZO_003504 [Myxococcota bacterium]|jgi:hypothetical protein